MTFLKRLACFVSGLEIIYLFIESGPLRIVRQINKPLFKRSNLQQSSTRTPHLFVPQLNMFYRLTATLSVVLVILSNLVVPGYASATPGHWHAAAYLACCDKVIDTIG